METTKCYFAACNNDVAPGSWKCHFHKSRRKCIVPDCRNQVSARQRCVSHGGKEPCAFPSCDANARIRGYCGRHGVMPKKLRCTFDGCTKFAHARQRCVAHGGGRRCSVHGCTSLSRNRGMCQRHGKQVEYRHNIQANTQPKEEDDASQDDDEIKEVDWLVLDEVLLNAAHHDLSSLVL